MKYTFYGLILVNIVFFLWESNILGRGSHSDAPYRELQLPRTVEQIVLLRERKDLPEKNADVDLAEVSATAAKSEQVREWRRSQRDRAGGRAARRYWQQYRTVFNGGLSPKKRGRAGFWSR